MLRLATLLGPGVHTFYTRMLSKRVVPVVLGYDPLVQFLHPEDALDAARLALERALRGGEHRAARRDHAADRAAPRGQGHGAGAAPRGLRARGPVVGRRLGEAPGGFMDYVRYPCVADGEKARASSASRPATAAARRSMAFLRTASRRRRASRAPAERPSEAEAARGRA